MPDGYKVALRNNATGEVRLIPYEYNWGDPDDGTSGEASHFLWTEGNYGCDCNRALWFYDWGPESEDRECGYTAFSALYAELPDGRRIQLDGVYECDVRVDKENADAQAKPAD